MNTGAQPIPIRIWPRMAVPSCVACAKTRQPNPPTQNTRLTVRRGPQRSSATPMGIWAAAKAQNQAEESIPRRAGSSPRSAAISGATTARAVRKNWLST